MDIKEKWRGLNWTWGRISLSISRPQCQTGFIFPSLGFPSSTKRHAFLSKPPAVGLRLIHDHRLRRRHCSRTLSPPLPNRHHHHLGAAEECPSVRILPQCQQPMRLPSLYPNEILIHYCYTESKAAPTTTPASARNTPSSAST